jgi:hypothetical protein
MPPKNPSWYKVHKPVMFPESQSLHLQLNQTKDKYRTSEQALYDKNRAIEKLNSVLSNPKTVEKEVELERVKEEALRLVLEHEDYEKTLEHERFARNVILENILVSLDDSLAHVKEKPTKYGIPDADDAMDDKLYVAETHKDFIEKFKSEDALKATDTNYIETEDAMKATPRDAKNKTKKPKRLGAKGAGALILESENELYKGLDAQIDPNDIHAMDALLQAHKPVLTLDARLEEERKRRDSLQESCAFSRRLIEHERVHFYEQIKKLASTMQSVEQDINKEPSIQKKDENAAQ